MTDEQVAKGLDLQTVIKSTKEAIKELDGWRERIKSKIEGGQINYDFNLCMAQYSNGSGHKVNLGRYHGNIELLNVIKETLEKQLKQYEEEFNLL
jgi:hypothetical protein